MSPQPKRPFENPKIGKSGNVRPSHLNRGPRESSAAGSVIDLRETFERVPGGRDAVRELARLMLKECPKLVGEIRAGLSAKDVERVQRGAHTLRGSAAVFGADRVVGIARQLEEIARDHKLTGAAGMLKALEREADRFTAALEPVARSGVGDS